MEFAEYKDLTVAILQDWYQAVENATAEHRYPDPHFVRPGGKPPYTDEEIDAIVAAIDEEIDGEIQRNRAHWNAKGIYRGSGFVRLAATQRRALVEELAGATDRWQQERSRPPEPSVAPPPYPGAGSSGEAA